MSETNLLGNISEIICTRISHDIIGNVGAVANAVELLEEGDMDFIDDIRSILKVSSRVLSSRLKFFRLAFGLSNSNLTDITTIKKISADYLQTIGNASFPISLDMSISDTSWARPSLLIIMTLADVLVKGGQIEIKEIDGRLAAIVHSSHPLASEKIKTIKELISGKIPENIAQYAPVVYLQKILNNLKKINIIEDNTFGFIIQ